MNIISRIQRIAGEIQQMNVDRETLLDRRCELRSDLPAWAIQALMLSGMTREEILTAGGAGSVSERVSELQEIDLKLRELADMAKVLEAALTSTSKVAAGLRGSHKSVVVNLPRVASSEARMSKSATVIAFPSGAVSSSKWREPALNHEAVVA